ncbi:hypothetical protein HPP92_027429 [Vanilla planifolia]|uniref:Uncharacterized protein n=1 Tax=Vanilla planifolia TaxID=51239 RepID=A0A835U612_VANPL|nr:hypothetical protein HPP92_027429 [Vanilla planifolia]
MDPFPTTVAFTPFEARQCFPILQMISKISARGQNNRGNFMAVKTCREFEPEWLDLLGKILVGFPIVPVGFLPPSFDDDEESQPWVRIAAWLDRKEPSSVLYAAFGSELKFTTEQIDEIASGLERSDVPFVWALREGCLPDGFEERVGDRGIVVEGWVPQARILSHSSIGAFLNHGGPSGIVEGLMAGVALVVLPMQFEQGLNARLLSEKGLGAEVFRDYEDGSFSGEEIARKVRMVMVFRDYEDGSFSGEEIARKVRMVMVEKEGEGLRARARAGKEKFGNEEVQDRYVKELANFMWENKVHQEP